MFKKRQLLARYLFCLSEITESKPVCFDSGIQSLRSFSMLKYQCLTTQKCMDVVNLFSASGIEFLMLHVPTL